MVSVDVKHHVHLLTILVVSRFWPSGKALGWYAEGPRFESASALLSPQKLWSVDTVL